MASIADLLAALQNGVFAIRSLQTTPFAGGAVSAINTINSTMAVQIIGANANRINISFHNPGTLPIYVYPATLASGTPNLPTFTNLGGTFQVLPGGFLTVFDASLGAWSAFSSAGSSNALTIMDNP